ncbi:MAG: arylesterase [Bacteriovoracaceae bacterium]|jgi:acyl-CoA thioesterase I|nr:arylesterase [Bacteriovoracaceae bacterium]
MKKTLLIFLMFVLPALAWSIENTREKQTTILFIGDSLTEGYGVAQENGYVSLIESELKEKGKSIKILNGSVSGSTTSSGLKRLKWFLKAKPDILFLELGANDGLRGVKLDVSRKNLDDIILLALKNKMRVLLAGMMLPPNYGPEYTKNFKNMFIELTKKHNINMIPFILEGVAGQKDLNLADGIHPNEKGHKILKSTVIKYLEPLL